MILFKITREISFGGKYGFIQQQNKVEIFLRNMSSKPAFMSPKRGSRMFMDPGGIPNSPPFKDAMLYPWNWGFGAQNIALSPSSSCGSPESDRDFKLRRGRPRADKISSLIVEGSNTPSSIRCKICSRIFPREKSLQAHLRTHTGKFQQFRL